MKRNTTYEIKTLFDPLSKEWEETDYEKKRILLVEAFREYKKLERNLALPSFISRIQGDDLNEDEFGDEPLVAYNNILFATGFYLNKLIDQSFEFPNKVKQAKAIVANLKQLKDDRIKRTQELQEIIRTKCRNNTREFFDLPGAEGESSKIPEKIIKLKKLHEHGITPLEILYLHVLYYKSMKTHDHVVSEAPYSAFALFWDGDQLL